MNKLFRQLVSRFEDHLSDEQMANLFCRELSLTDRLIAKRHLATCRYCRVRKEDLEGRRADRVIGLYREALSDEDLALTPQPREEFLRRLQSQILEAPAQGWWARHLPRFDRLALPPRSPVFATCLVLGVAGAISFFLWHSNRTPTMSSNMLLTRAEQWDDSNLAEANSGVVVQAVRITTASQTWDRSIYRDMQGRRQARLVRLNATEDQLRGRLVEAGLNWDQPISAASYQGWHDHQHVREDRVVRAGSHLLKLTTTVADGSVSEQSLTVRDTDFHPVRRTVAFRDRETVEIAEVDFKVLPWSSVDAGLFEAAETVTTAAPAALARALPLPHAPEFLTEAQLEETELGARLILNQLHADTGEQIEIGRLPQGVEIKGLVETDERKRELQSQLRIVPHLTIAIQSVADLRKDPSGGDVLHNVRAASMPEQPSPLETYLLPNGRSVSAISTLSRRLFNSALTISQESKAITDLQTRFDSGAQKSVVASATLSELIYSHRERLEAALNQERELLAEARGASAVEEHQVRSKRSLLDAATRNLALCKELTESNGSAAGNAEKILAEMSVSLEDLVGGVRESHIGPHSGTSAMNGKK